MTALHSAQQYNDNIAVEEICLNFPAYECFYDFKHEKFYNRQRFSMKDIFFIFVDYSKLSLEL